MPLVGDPGHGIFRIYRDVRFSPDKRLYKTHAGAVLTRSGGKRDPGLLYLHVAPGKSMVAAGFWHPEPDLLTRLRRAVLDDPDGFLAIARGLEAAGYPMSSAERLSRPPRGFEAAKGTAVAEYVRLEIVHSPCRPERCRDAIAGVDQRILIAHTAMPLLEWGWATADDEGPASVPIRALVRPLAKPDF